jgi:hypothetical protein
VDCGTTAAFRAFKPFHDGLGKLPKLFPILVDRQAAGHFSNQERGYDIAIPLIVDPDVCAARIHASLATSNAK